MGARSCIKCYVPLVAGENCYVSQIEHSMYYCNDCKKADKNLRRRNGMEPLRSRRHKVIYCDHPECDRIVRQTVLERGDFTCGICYDPIDGEWHMDHIIPVSKKGKHCYYNLQPSHPECNILKGDTILVE